MMLSQAAVRERAAVINGVNVPALMETINEVRKNPAIATFRFRGKNAWLGGDHNRTTIKGFYGACQEHRTDSVPFLIDNSEPAVLLGQDKGANPAEHLLSALMGCMTTTMAYHAASRGIEIKAIDTEAEGELDLRGFLGLSDTIRKGYQQIRVRMRVKSPASPETLRALTKFSPIFDVVSNSVPVDVVVETY
jgi:uncharacterized OsmC-like protein